MISLDKIQTIEGVTVYGDDEKPDLFYPIPNYVRYRFHDDGKPIFSFFEYLRKVENPAPNGANIDAGALCLFDVEFTLPKELEDKIRQNLEKQLGKPVKFGKPTYITGTAEILQRQGTLINSIYNQGVPSLYGNMVTAFNAELSEKGADLFKAALSGDKGIIQVVYKLKAPARCGKLSMKVKYESQQVYDFVQEIKQKFPEVKDRNIIHSGEFQRKLNETMKQQQVGTVTIDDTRVSIGLEGAARVAFDNAKTELRTWGMSVLKDKIAKGLEGLPPVSEEERKDFEKAANEAQKNGLHNIGWFWLWCVVSPDAQKEVKKKNIQTFELEFAENTTIEWTITPQGTLPPITDLPKKGTEKWKWNEFYKRVDPNASSFRRYRWEMKLLYDLAASTIIPSVTLNVYHPGLENGMKSHTFDAQNFQLPLKLEAWAVKADDTLHPASFEYSYTVNFKNRAPYKSEKISVNQIENTALNLFDLGVLELDVQLVGVQFSQDDLLSVKVELAYKDEANGIKFIPPPLVFSATALGSRRIREPILKKLDKPVQYKETWYMPNARVVKDWENFYLQSGSENTLSLTDVMIHTHSKKVGGLGFDDDTTKVKKIDFTVTYEDPAFQYVKKVSGVLEDDDLKEIEILAPVPSKDAKFYYDARIFFEGKKEIKQIPKKAFTTDTLIISPVETEQMEIIIKSAKGVWPEVEMVELSITHPASGVSENFEFPKSGQEVKDIVMELDKWVIDIPKGSSKKYNWEAIFTMKDDDDKRVAEKENDVGKILTLKLPPKQ